MSEKIVVPTLGESVTEATVAKWLKNKGDKVSSDEPLVELETDKVNVEVPSPSNGILINIAAKEGETVNVGALLGSIISIKSTKQVLKLKKMKKNILHQNQKKSSPKNTKINLNKLKRKKTINKPLILEEEY